MKKKTIFVLLSAMVGLLPLATTTSVATDTGQPAITSITIDSDGPTSSSSLTVKLHEKISSMKAGEIRDDLKDPIQERSIHITGTGTYEDKLWCNNKAYSSDSNGQWNIAYQCLPNTRKRTVPWGFAIATPIQAAITGNVSEGGMFWWKNNVSMTKNAAHTKPTWYNFHGNFNPVGEGDKIHCQDHMTFAMRIGGKPAHGSLTINCNATLMN